ncbi:MAG: 3-oxoacid CoA-transferase subunit B [Dehalococcoidia bacterium]|nr:3-oxoacid CoA-transferase subunit B [Dehalococcoidia bacterium]
MTTGKPRLDREAVAARAARELPDGAVVNLGIGIPTLASQFVPAEKQVLFHSENGVLRFGPLAGPGEQDEDLINASLQFLVPVPGMSFFDSVAAFEMIRGGHVDIAILGALQVSERGDLANWRLPTRAVGNIGGAMDLVAGAKRIVVAMEHTDNDDHPKVLSDCTYPVTGRQCVSLIITDIAVIEVMDGGTRGRLQPKGLLLREVAPGWTVEEIQALTGARLHVASDLREIQL